MVNDKPIKNWKNILWREWYHCHDKDYARRLYHAVATGPFSWFKRFVVGRQPRPYAAEVEAALYEVCKAQWGGKFVWAKNLRRLEQAKDKSISIQKYIADLQHHHWLKRFIARHVLLYRGGEAIRLLEALVHPDTPPRLQQTLRWLVESISVETSARLVPATDEWVCPNCLVRCHVHWINRSLQPDLSFYGCRYCRRSYRLLHCPQGVVAILDAGQMELYHQQGDSLYVNWSIIQTMFDFDRVEIINATDEDVERFAIQVGNDTDPTRESGYRRMYCYINSKCKLSKNSIRILENTFGQIEQVRA